MHHGVVTRVDDDGDVARTRYANDSSEEPRGTDSTCKDRDHVPERNDRFKLE